MIDINGEVRLDGSDDKDALAGLRFKPRCQLHIGHKVRQIKILLMRAWLTVSAHGLDGALNESAQASEATTYSLVGWNL